MVCFLGCFFDVMTNAATAPLITQAKGQFVEPSANGSIHIGFRESMYISCPGGQFTPPGLNPRGQFMNCMEGTTITIGASATLDFANFTCTDRARPYVEVTIDTEIQCENGTFGLRAGYTVSDLNGFVTVYTACFRLCDTPLYIKSKVNKWARSGQNYPEAPRYVFDFGIFCGNALERYDNYEARFEEMGLQDYINDVHYLTKGQLAPHDDFLYVLQRDATYSLVNVAPQWNTFDEGNWRSLENGILNLLQSQDIEGATILTGILKIATLTNSTGDEIELRIATTATVPRWFWKIIYFPELHFGAVFFGYNNPYVNKFLVDAEFLREICSTDIFGTLQSSWMLNDIDNTDPFLGYTYACPLNTVQIIDPLIGEIVTNFLGELNVTKSGIFP
ncbi:hypothetical protein Zmor_015658 [Zophobas morio]|uniref:DNA/RNA non-specific endonuclease/pyrophosphatase/phosphodiesterase domain-containing protein n=1 Tax=Zophobas morio TaxID=2755281 RepID=A0AA38MHV1_9CUCU|nr:hypothetical protein Zmor_015658 [Zophobas morio]